MAHFPFWANRSFSIQMENRARLAQQIQHRGCVGRQANVVTDEVEHDGGTEQSDFPEGQPTKCPHLLFKLRHRTGIQRIVTGVMGTWGNFVDE